jgi:uncharacterized LabA/DUF88 family protein
LNSKKTAAIFVDVQNIYYTTKEGFGKNFDYNKFWTQATKDFTIVKACAYAIASNDEKQRQFQNILRGIGFEVKLKPFIQRKDGSAKGDWDVGIALDVMEYAATCDKIILASGDGDFDLLALKTREKFNVDFEVYGVANLTATSLINAASNFIAIEKELLITK